MEEYSTEKTVVVSLEVEVNCSTAALLVAVADACEANGVDVVRFLGMLLDDYRGGAKVAHGRSLPGRVLDFLSTL